MPEARQELQGGRDQLLLLLARLFTLPLHHTSCVASLRAQGRCFFMFIKNYPTQ
jgi:hypothetical protein